MSPEMSTVSLVTGAVHAESLPLDVTDPASIAAELRHDHVLVNAICPGWVATDVGGPGGRPVEAGAASVVWAATLPDSCRCRRPASRRALSPAPSRQPRSPDPARLA
jgi:NAD(P)-dependent dehydrogenase (short-subunit alcohol dehydrogenase family)